MKRLCIARIGSVSVDIRLSNRNNPLLTHMLSRSTSPRLILFQMMTRWRLLDSYLATQACQWSRPASETGAYCVVW